MRGLQRSQSAGQDKPASARLGTLWAAAWAAALLGLAGCGPRLTTLAECEAKHGGGPRMTVMPPCVDTVRGAMAVEEEYLPGVVDCELGWFTTAAPALEAQAIAARTYLGSFLQRHGEDRPVKMTAVFQCWRPPAHARSRHAVQATRDVVMHADGELLFGNYVAGAKHRDTECRPLPPSAHKLSGWASWDAMRTAYRQARKRGDRSPFRGVYWTEILVTENAGKTGDAVTGTPFARKSPLNRGALSQYGAACLAKTKGLETDQILKWFYGDDVVLSRPWSRDDATKLRALEDDGEVEAERPEVPET
ncbi:MAG: hypothetical protein KC613_07960 [Myxococcales bacterium]|nr:hypothetical protein [Myxococcales bacterium]